MRRQRGQQHRVVNDCSRRSADCERARQLAGEALKRKMGVRPSLVKGTRAPEAKRRRPRGERDCLGASSCPNGTRSASSLDFVALSARSSAARPRALFPSSRK